MNMDTKWKNFLSEFLGTEEGYAAKTREIAKAYEGSSWDVLPFDIKKGFEAAQECDIPTQHLGVILFSDVYSDFAMDNRAFIQHVKESFYKAITHSWYDGHERASYISDKAGEFLHVLDDLQAAFNHRARHVVSKLACYQELVIPEHREAFVDDELKVMLESKKGNVCYFGQACGTRIFVEIIKFDAYSSVAASMTTGRDYLKKKVENIKALLDNVK